MKIFYAFFIFLLLISCQKEEIILPDSIKKIDSKYLKPKQEIIEKRKIKLIRKRKRKMKLSDSKIGEVKIILEVSGQFANRLTDLGCTPGTKIKKILSVRKGPSAYEVAGDYVLALRKEEANSIIVSSL